MRRRHPTRPLLPAALAALLLAPAPDAAAQLTRGPVMRQDPDRQQRPPPAALPGLTGRRSAPVIPGDPTVSLPPNEALFDAINRGDLPAAREAIARGANVDARNVLGLTPIDSAVDQGRTEIMFYLLSVRGVARAGSGPPPGTPGAAAAAAGGRPPPTPAQSRRAEAAAAAAATREERAAAAASAREARARPVAPAAQAPRLWSGDGGAPIPSVGFTGFDAGRPAGGAPPQAESRGGRGSRSGRG